MHEPIDDFVTLAFWEFRHFVTRHLVTFGSCYASVFCTDPFCNGYIKNKLMLLAGERQLCVAYAWLSSSEVASWLRINGMSQRTFSPLLLGGRTERFWGSRTVRLLGSHYVKSKRFWVGSMLLRIARVPVLKRGGGGLIKATSQGTVFVHCLF